MQVEVAPMEVQKAKVKKPNTRDLAKRAIDEYTPEFQAAWRKTVTGVIEAGQVLLRAKEDKRLQHGSWTPWIEQTLKISMSTAAGLMRVAEHGVLSKLQHAAILPPHWYTLVELATIPSDQLSGAIEGGKVHPGMERKDVAALKRELAGEDEPTTRNAQQIIKRVKEASKAETAEAVNGAYKERDEAVTEKARLKASIKALEAEIAILKEAPQSKPVSDDISTDVIAESVQASARTLVHRPLEDRLRLCRAFLIGIGVEWTELKAKPVRKARKAVTE